MQHDEAIKKVADLLGKTNIATLATIRSERIVCRPMVVQPAEFDGDVWFFRYKDSNKIQEIDLNPEVNIAFESGKAELVEDRQKLKNCGIHC